MRTKERKRLVESVLSEIIKRKGRKVKFKTKHRKDKRKFTSRRDARHYEKALRQEYRVLLNEELERLLKS